MYVSLRDDTLIASGFANLVEGLRYYGASGVELFVDRQLWTRALIPTAETPRIEISGAGEKRLADEARENGIRIAAFCLGTNFNAPDIDAEIDWIVRVVEIAARLDVPAIRIDAIMRGERDLPIGERQEIFARGVRRVLSRTKDAPVDLGIENHGFQGNDPAFLEALLALVDSPRLGLTMDTGNFYWAGYPLDEVYRILERFAPLAKHTHVKNIRYPEDVRNVRRELGFEYGRYVCPIAEGDIDHARVVGYLKAAGYDRDICLEDESLGKFDEPQRRANVKAAVDFFKPLL